jgi:CHAT domain-containing protein/tetratricopeptide (TPR) repeat protein
LTILPPPPLRSVLSPRRVIHCVWGLAAALASGCVSSPPAAPVPLTAPAIASPAPATKVKDLILRPGVAVDRDLLQGGRDEIPLDLKAEDYVSVLFDAGGLDLDARLLGPGGETVFRVEGSDGHLSAIAKVGGKYRLAVTLVDPKTRGQYRVTLEDLRASGAGDADRVAAAADLSEANRLGSRGEYDKKIGKAQEALALCRKIQDRSCEFEALYEIGNSYWSTGGKDKALLTYRTALEVADTAANRRNQARAGAALGTVLTQPRTAIDAENARPYLEHALSFWRESGNSYRQSRVLFDLAVGRYSMGRFDEAIDSYEKALTLTDPAGALASNIWNGLGNVYASRGESLKALQCFDTALRIAEETKNEGAEAAVLTSIGNIYQRRGEPLKAIHNFEEALKINQSEPELEKKYRVSVLLQIGSVDLDLGQADDALAEYQKALDASQRYEDSWGISNALWSIGRVELVRDRPQDALEHLGKALEIATQKQIISIQAAVLHEIGVARLKLHQLPQAVKSLEDALPLRKKTNRLGEALTRQALGKAYLEEGDLARADSFLSDALKIADEVGASLPRSSIHYDLARLQRRQDRLPKALSEIEQAITILETVRSDISQDRLRTSFFASRRSYYELWVSLLMELDRRYPGQGYKDKALAASDMGRARALLDLLSQGRLELKHGIDQELRTREAEVKARLTQIQRSLVAERSGAARALFIEALETRLQEVDREQREVEAEIKLKHPLYYQFRYPSPLERNDIQHLLPSKDSALLEYSLGEQGAYLFVVTAEGLAVHPLALSQQEISEEIRRIGSGFKPGGQLPFSYKKAAYRLYETLIAPAKDELAGKRHLLIAPDGILNYLPFEALLTRQARGEESLPYLLYDFSISYIPSASVLASLSLQRPPVVAGSGTAMRFLAFAPDYGPEASPEQGRSAIPESRPLPDLEGARQEVQEIAKRYPGEAKVYLGPEASRKNFESPLVSDRIHFAGHGLSDEEHPENSALILSDGPLRVSDIFNLDLKADLVVLSACKTAGKQVTGEGLVGLTRAFLYAGSPSVVVTLWQVIDSPTSDLMKDLYGNLDRTGDKAEALRQAKIGMIQRRGRLARPYYWAPFVLVGKPR